MSGSPHQKLPTTLIPAQITGLRGLEFQTPARIVDVSSRGLRIGASEPVPVGSLLQIELDDSTIVGEVRYCQPLGSWYAIGLFVQEMLIGMSDHARLLATLIEETDTAEPEAVRWE